jgi:hypothetical protein
MTGRCWLVLALLGTWVGGAGRVTADDQGPILFDAGTSTESSAPIADRHPLPRWRTIGAGEVREIAPHQESLAPVGQPPAISDADVWQDEVPPATPPKIIDRRRSVDAPAADAASEPTGDRPRRRTPKTAADAALDREQKPVLNRQSAKSPSERLESVQKSLRERTTGRPGSASLDESREFSSERGARANPYDQRPALPDGASSRRTIQPTVPGASRTVTPTGPAYYGTQPSGIQGAPRVPMPQKQPAPQTRTKSPAGGGNAQRKPASSWPRTGQIPGSAR